MLFNFEGPQGNSKKMERLGKTQLKAPLWGYSSDGRAPALQAGGQRFEPVYLHQGLGEGKSATAGKKGL